MIPPTGPVHQPNLPGEKESAEKIGEVVEILEEAKDITDVEEAKKKGIFKKMRQVVEDLGDKNSTLHKSIEGMKRGVSIAQDVAENYNKVAQWIGWPQVPKPFLKKEE